MIYSRVFDQERDYRDRAYCSIAAAMIGGSVIGAGASIWGANKAADAQTKAANASIENSRYMFDQSRNALQPFISAGQDATGKLQSWIDPTSGTNPLSSLIKLTTPGASMAETLAQTHGFDFTQKMGQRAITNALAGRGLGGSAGAIMKNVGEFSSGLASTTWDSVVKNLLSTFGAGTNALQGLVSTGANAGGALAGNATQTGSQINSAITGAGNAQAAGYNAIGGAISNMSNNIPTAYLMSQLTGGGGGSIYGNGVAGYDTYGGVTFPKVGGGW